MNKKLFFISFITLVAIVIDLPKNYPLRFKLFGHQFNYVISSPTLNLDKPFKFHRDFRLREGLDIQGGMAVTLEADMSKIKSEDRNDALKAAKEVIARRIDLYGVSEASIRTFEQNSHYRIIVALPGLDNYQDALNLIGTTAQLEFREVVSLPKSATPSAGAVAFKTSNLTGKDLKKASVQFDPQTGKPVVSLQFNQDGAKKFAELTAKNINKPLAIFLDNQLVSAPIVQQKITGGQAVISGHFTLDQAKELAITLNAGALPVPIKVIQQQNIAPTLGRDSVKRSVQAGAVGLLMVALFMILLYGRAGFIAVIGLVIYSLITLAIYKLIPVTVSLPGLAGLILSIGMAADANILIFERMKEELRRGYEWHEAMELGFGRTWDSIKDANAAIFITTFVLFNPLNWPFLNTSGMVRGFALTLFLGVIVSLFTGIYVTRTLLRAFYVKKR